MVERVCLKYSQMSSKFIVGGQRSGQRPECGTKRYSNACSAVSKTCHPVIAWEQKANAFESEFLASERERLPEKSE